LCGDEENIGLVFGRIRAIQDFFSDGQGALRIALPESAKRHSLQILIRFGVQDRLLSGGLFHFEFESFGVFFPAALRVLAFYFRNRGQCRSFFAELVFSVGFPVESGVGLRTVIWASSVNFLTACS